MIWRRPSGACKRRTTPDVTVETRLAACPCENSVSFGSRRRASRPVDFRSGRKRAANPVRQGRANAQGLSALTRERPPSVPLILISAGRADPQTKRHVVEALYAAPERCDFNADQTLRRYAIMRASLRGRSDALDKRTTHAARRRPVHAFMPHPPVAVPGRAGGKLQSLTFGVKDLFEIAGYPTARGNPVKLAERDGEGNAPVVQTLLDAGALFVGKTHTEELAWSLYGNERAFRHAGDPAALDRVPGGSTPDRPARSPPGFAISALGTDTGVARCAPLASFCGLYGLRPTHGAIFARELHASTPSLRHLRLRRATRRRWLLSATSPPQSASEPIA